MKTMIFVVLILGIFTCLVADEFSDTIESICRTGYFYEGADGLKYFILNEVATEEAMEMLAQNIAYVCIMFAPVRLNWWPVAETQSMANIRLVEYICGTVSNEEGDFLMVYPMSSMDVYTQEEFTTDYDAALRNMYRRVYTEYMWWSCEDVFDGGEDW